MDPATSLANAAAIERYPDLQIEIPDCLKDFELNPLQLQLTFFEGNLLSGGAYAADTEFELAVQIARSVSPGKNAEPGSVYSGSSASTQVDDTEELPAHPNMSDSEMETDSEYSVLSESEEDYSDVDRVAAPCVVRESLRPTVYETFTKSGLDWCRYCGVTKSGQTTASFRPGPWGKRTLCNKHGCDYKGYGYADKQSRLDLSSFTRESVQDRIRPVIQDYCISCFQRDSLHSRKLVQCDGCARAYHPECYGRSSHIDNEIWYCEPTCEHSRAIGKIALDLPKARLPYMILGNSDNRRDSTTPPYERRGSTASVDSMRSYKSLRRDSGLDMTMPGAYAAPSDDEPAAGDGRAKRQRHHITTTRHHPYARQTTCR
ncbi:hypothetical protein HDU86_006429 [Geranomyces michiganensis]|nr:hypothetical protein HDU86_006429 [Geranomyces michiganensis]